MNAPIYPQKLQGRTIYHTETVEGEYNDETEEYDDDTEVVTDGTVLGISLDSDGDFYFLVETEGSELQSWHATLCYLEDPR